MVVAACPISGREQEASQNRRAGGVPGLSLPAMKPFEAVDQGGPMKMTHGLSGLVVQEVRKDKDTGKVVRLLTKMSVQVQATVQVR